MREKILRAIAEPGRPGALRLVIYGKLPSKKNKLRPRSRRSGGRAHMYDKETKAELDSMTMQARVAWGARRPLESPNVDVYFFVANPAKDRDGIWTSVLDCLKNAGVILDDSIALYNGIERKHPAEIVEAADERVEVVIDPRVE